MSKIKLRELTPDDVKGEEGYVSWLNDPEVNKYLECRHTVHTIDSVRSYVQDMLNSDDNILYGIFLDGLHVGNFKFTNISWRYRHSDIGVLIAKEYWGKGIWKEVIKQAETIAFSELGLHKLHCTPYAYENEASLKGLLSCGWRLVGEYRDHVIDDNGSFMNVFILEKIRCEK